MDALLLLGGLIALLIVDLLALLWGADSRDAADGEFADHGRR